MKIIFLKIKDLIGKYYPKMQVEIFANQFERLANENNNELPINLPAILVEFSNIDWVSSKGKQEGRATITIHIGQDIYSEYSSIKTDTFKVLELVDKIYIIIQNETTEISSPFKRKTTKFDKEQRAISVYQIGFETTITDISETLKDEILFVTPDIIVIEEE